ncbi:MAG: DUF4340 domain-containing protein [Bacteroidales bacterium]
MKKNRIILLITLLLAVLALVLVINNSGSTLKKEHSEFGIDDTASVTRIFMADKASHSVELVRGDSGVWKVNKEFNARPDAIQTFLKTILNLEVVEPVAKSGRNTIIKRLASSGVKVEIYQKVYRIDFWGFLRLFPHEKLTKVYYVGSNTPDNMGTYMIMEGSDVPFITYLPGFRGFIAVRYSPRPEDWRDHTVFALPISTINSVKVEFVEVPGFSFEVKKAGERSFSLNSLSTGQLIPDYDTIRVLELLTAFGDLRFETLVTGFSPEKTDSILSSQPFHIITVLDHTGKQHKVKTFHRKNPGGDTDEDGNYIPFDRDRMYASINDRRELVLIQFFVFDPVIQPVNAYLKKQ